MTIATKKINENSAAPNKGRTYGAIAQLGERLPCKQEVGSSILPGSTTMLYWLSWRLCGSAHYFYYYLSQKAYRLQTRFFGRTAITADASAVISGYSSVGRAHD